MRPERQLVYLACIVCGFSVSICNAQNNVVEYELNYDWDIGLSEVAEYDCLTGELGAISADLTGTFKVTLSQSRTGVYGKISDIDFKSVFDLYHVTGTGEFSIAFDLESPTGLPALGALEAFTVSINGGEAVNMYSVELGSTDRYPRLILNASQRDRRGQEGHCYELVLTAMPKGWDEVIRFFLRGDADSNGSLSLSDPITVLKYLLFAQEQPSPCLDAMDADDSGKVDLSDVIVLLTRLFLGGAELPLPGKPCGLDPTDDGIGCTLQPVCMWNPNWGPPPQFLAPK